MADDGNNGFEQATFCGLGEFVKAVFAHKAGAAPCAKANKIQPAFDLVQGVAGQTQAQLSSDEFLNLRQMADAGCAGFAKNYKVIHVAAVQPHTKLALDKVV